MALKVYVAGAWVEQNERAKPMIARLQAAGVIVTHDWTAPNGFVEDGVGGDSKLTDEARKKYALADLRGVFDAELVWLLAANSQGACGSWVELGAALTARMLRANMGPIEPFVIVSGPKNKRTIFTEIADRLFDTDAEALDAILAYAGCT
jgi:hypothetical protein